MLMPCAGFSKCHRGTTTVEFAFVAPAMFLLMTASLFLGLLVYSAMGMQGAVEKAARCYSINDSQVNATQCKTASSTQTYAQTNYFGVAARPSPRPYLHPPIIAVIKSRLRSLLI